MLGSGARQFNQGRKVNEARYCLKAFICGEMQVALPCLGKSHTKEIQKLKKLENEVITPCARRVGFWQTTSCLNILH